MAGRLGTYALLALLCAVLQGNTLAQEFNIPPIPEDFESRCIFPGLEFLQGCEPETLAALRFFNLSNNDPETVKEAGLTEDDVNNYLDTAPPPSEQCCTKSCGYSNQLCNCAPTALGWAVELFGGGEVYKTFARRYAAICGYTDLIDNCPDDADIYLETNPTLNTCNFTAAVVADGAAASAPAGEDMDVDLDGL